MTPQLANQFATLAVKLFVLVLLPLLAYLARTLINEGLASIQDVRLRNAAAQLVSTAEATLAVAGKDKFAFVLRALQEQFPALPVTRFAPVIEDELAKLQIKLGTFTPAKTPAQPAPAPIPVLDAGALQSALTTGLSSLVPPALTSQVATIVDDAFKGAVTTIDQATAPVQVQDQKTVETPAPVVSDKTEAGTPAIVLPAGVVPPVVTEPTKIA